MWGQKFLTVGCWNIEGIYEKFNGYSTCKLNDEIFLKSMNGFDILCLQETHVSDTENFDVPENFVAIPHCRNVSGNGRYFGGMLLLIRKSLRKGVIINKDFDVDILVMTLRKDYFDLERDLTIFFAYASPISSPYMTSRSENVIEKLELNMIDGRNTCLVMGDLNGRTKDGDDFVRDNFDKHSPIVDIPDYDKDNVLERNNQDPNPIDNQGKLILDLCKSNALRIANGRIQGDNRGKFTRYPKRPNEKPSVIDYLLCGESILPKIFSFSVLPFTDLSDHCCISANIKIKVPADPVPEGNLKLNPNPTRLGYDKEKKHIFQLKISSSEKLEPLLESLKKIHDDNSDLHLCIKQLNEVILDAAAKTFLNNKRKPSRPKKQKSKTWFNDECSKLRKASRKHARLLSTTPFDKEKLHAYRVAKNRYKRACRKAEKESRDNLKQKLFEIGLNDPKRFWNIVKQMNNWGKGDTEKKEVIPPTTWKTYFEKLLNTPVCEASNKGISPTFNPLLDGLITVKELRDALKKMKNGKAPGPDGILIEYLKAFGETFEEILLKIVRQIFARQEYPDEWNSNYLKPLFKKGETDDPGNYRGLAVGSALAKFFSLILLNRLMNFINDKSLISNNQIGFMNGYWTADHVFLLQTIIEKIVKKGKKKLYSAFIDFSKAYDTVDRNKLFSRLEDLGINGIFLNNLKAMYAKTSYKIKLSNGFIDPILSNLGLKQGCPLSPILFNIYIDDIKDIFDPSCDPVRLHDEDIYHFLYADDLVILSNSVSGLQRSLDKLASYSAKKKFNS